MKKILNLMVIFVFTITVATGCGCENKDKEEKKEETKVNTNEEVIKDQTVDVLTFTNTSLVYEDNNSKLQTTVTNTSDEDVYLAEFLIHVKDENGAEIVTMRGFVGGVVEAKSSKVINSVYGDDLTTAASIEYEIVK